ncbi:arylsulfatase [Sinorhizobium sp. A49]|uniref:sulfatase family protein n=1 Tax=Sinorhizobium sp. A49 TaxID=1945861 RepID=UPI0009852FB6|nr:sulfatase-like hydrolase/transferase [Sinorhizobium sp. A49]OOG63162.1 arylsulfatase [Sinorhizobium sp. A49]
MKKPNVVVIMADQLRYDFIGTSYMPHLQALQADSCLFPNAYCASPLCVPSRGGFFTGRYPNSTGCLINPWVEADRQRGFIADGIANLYDLLSADWDGWHSGKQHLMYQPLLETREGTRTKWNALDDSYGAFLQARGHRPPGGARFRGIVPELTSGAVTSVGNYSLPATGCYEPGFDSFFDGYILRSATDAIENRDRSRPFFLSAMFLAPHPPFDVPEPWFSLAREFDPPDNVGVWFSGQSPLQLYNLPGFLGARYSRDDWKEIWRVYAGLVALLDHCIGELVSRLKAEGIYDETLIVFTSDHGEMLGSHRLWQKMCMYEESVRTPLIFKLPAGMVGMGICEQPVSHIDVLPTICELLGIERPADLPGTSLLPAMRGGMTREHRDIFIQYDGNGAFGNFSRCIICKSHKLIVDIFKDEIFFELYALASDAQETTNLVVERADLAAELFSKLVEHMRVTGDHVALAPDALQQFILRMDSVHSA